MKLSYIYLNEYSFVHWNLSEYPYTWGYSLDKLIGCKMNLHGQSPHEYPYINENKRTLIVSLYDSKWLRKVSLKEASIISRCHSFDLLSFEKREVTKKKK